MKLPLLLSTLALTTQAYHLFDGIANILGSSDEERLIILNDNEQPIKIKESEKFRLKRSGVNFIDITNHKSWFYKTFDTPENIPVYNYPTSVNHTDEVNALIEQIDKTKLHDNLAQFSNFYSRYYKSENGLKSSDWLFEKLKSIVSGAGKSISVKKFHHEWLQNSIIVHIEGAKTPENIIVVGAHQDSTNLLLPNILKAPGADDDGSGVTTNLEALRIIVENGIVFENSVEFHFYSAEEGGLLGSLDIFTDYKSQGLKVISMLQQDMTGYVQKTLDNDQPEHVGVISDYVSQHLTNFVKLIIDNYLSIPWVETKCGYACSDHASALKNGYPSSFIIESDFKYTNPYIHSTTDTLDRLSFDHIAEFTKLVLGYVYELGFHDIKELNI